MCEFCFEHHAVAVWHGWYVCGTCREEGRQAEVANGKQHAEAEAR